MISHLPELLAPAGDWSSLVTAVENGADSVYFGVKNLNMRHEAGNFDLLELKKVMAFLRERGRKGYLTLNTIISNNELVTAERVMAAAKTAQVDAVILWDMAALSLARQYGLPIHLSTQASVCNIAALQAYSALGVKRIVLARECTLKQISEIIIERNAREISCEVEGFVHGAMCLSVSGRCFLSSFSFSKSANRGECLQPCRREYEIVDRENEAKYILGHNYLLSPRDLCTIDFLDQLIDAGLDSFKIEGRIRPAEYVKETVRVYRQAIDAYASGELTEQLKQKLKGELGKVYNRGFSSGFYFGQPKKEALSPGLGTENEKIYVGLVTRFFKKIQVAQVNLQSRTLKIGDQILVTGKTTPAEIFPVTQMQSQFCDVQTALKGQSVGIKVPCRLRPGDKVFLFRPKTQ